MVTQEWLLNALLGVLVIIAGWVGTVTTGLLKQIRDKMSSLGEEQILHRALLNEHEKRLNNHGDRLRELERDKINGHKAFHNEKP